MKLNGMVFAKKGREEMFIECVVESTTAQHEDGHARNMIACANKQTHALHLLPPTS